MPNHIHGIIIIKNSNQNIKINEKYGFETAGEPVWTKFFPRSYKRLQISNHEII